jgi:prephenate dehydrogenase
LKVKQAVRLLRQDPTLHAEIEASNPHVPAALEAAARAAAELREAVAAGDREGFMALFEEAAGFFGTLAEEDYRELTRLFMATCAAEESG